MMRRYCFTLGALALLTQVAQLSLPAAEPPIRFDREIRPILSDKCFACHGPDENKRKAKLRLDTKEGILATLKDDKHAVVPGHLEQSELYSRITEKNPDDVMPPAESGKKLSPEEIAKLKRWIEQGAAYQEHWAFIPPKHPKVPEVKAKDWPRNPIDNFVLARLEKEGLSVQPVADKEILIRRATLSLTGLPPTPREIDAFLADNSSDAYEKMVDRLLKSPHYGEHMARYWLDAARYGDTHGLHLDNERSLWPYRDWVVGAFNRNMPFDKFTVCQLAGDLLPNATREQIIGTGFIRCNVSTSEGGAIPEEFAARYAVDRTDTMSTVWMGMTAGCAVCHDHKFDPLPQKDFYRLFAFFNSLDENPMDGNALLPAPVLPLPSPEQEKELASLDRKLTLVQKVIRADLNVVDYKEPEAEAAPKPLEAREFVWVDDAVPEGVKASTGAEAWKFVSQKDGPVYSGEKSVARTTEKEKVSQHYFTEAVDRLQIGSDDKLFAYVYLDPKNPPKMIMLQFNDGNWEHRAFWGENVSEWGQIGTGSRRRMGDLPAAGQWTRLEFEASQVGLASGSSVNGMAFTQTGGTVYWDKTGIISKLPQGKVKFESLIAWEAAQREIKKSSVPEEVRKIIQETPAKRTAEQQARLRDYFLEYVYDGSRMIFEPLHQQTAALQKERAALDDSIPKTMVAKELKEPRKTHILIRGQYDKLGDLVTPGVPSAIGAMLKEAPTNRLGLAKWLVDPSHPLTARVIVNRFWQHHFGIGIVKTAEDFGAQGEPPTHPDLLDWLATEFIASGWDIKYIQRLIVTSAAFRQSSEASPESIARDPENRLIARGPRYRLEGETIRDMMLAVSGLLVDKLGGHGVKPYQPEGIWEAVGYTSSNTARYNRDEGEALYRRTLYTFWKRTAPPPLMMTFDAPSRESCRVRRERTNTPLQALALMNDTQYVEASRELAERMLKEGGDSIEKRIAFGFRLATARFPDQREQQILKEFYQTQLKEYQQKPESAKKFIQVGEKHPDTALDPNELAAWTMVANTILNLSETITNI